MFATTAYGRYMAKVQPSYSTPVTDTVKKYLQVQYTEEKSVLKADLQKQIAVALTTDLWTSSKTQSFLAATVHYRSDEWVPQNSVLATKRMKGKHTGEDIYNCLEAIEKDYKIENKICWITSDNATNMKAAESKQKFISCDTAH